MCVAEVQCRQASLVQLQEEVECQRAQLKQMELDKDAQLSSLREELLSQTQQLDSCQARVSTFTLSQKHLHNIQALKLIADRVFWTWLDVAMDLIMKLLFS